MAINSSYITSVIERVNKQFAVKFSRREKLKKELSPLKTFLQCVESWSSVDEVVRERLAVLMADFKDAFADARLDLEDAEDGGEEKLIEAYSELQEKIEQVKPKMREGYVYLSEYCFRARLSVTDIEFWNDVLSALYNGLTDLVFDMKMAAPLKRQVEAFTEKIWSLSLLMLHLTAYLSDVKTFMPFWVYIGGAATCAAQMFYICWVDGMDANKAQGLILLLSDLQQKIMPCTWETIDVYLGLLKALRSYNSYYVHPCVKTLIQYGFSIKDQSESLRMGLDFLLRFLVTTPDEFSDDVKLMALDMKLVIVKTTSLDSTLIRRKTQRELELFQLVGKIEILKAEAVLMGLINRSTGDKTPSENPSESLLEGVKMLHTFIVNPPKGIIEQGKLILTHIEAVAIGSASLYETFHAKPLNEDVIRDVLKLLVNIKLLKAQIFWLELINKSTSLKDKVETLLEGLEGLRKIVSGKPNGDSDNGKLILVHVDEVACQAMSVYHSINANKGAENLIKEMENRLPDLLDKICLVKAEAENVYVRVRNSLRFNFPKTNRLGFFEFFLENLWKLLNRNPNSGSSVKHLMEAVLTDLESFRSFLRDTAEHCKLHSELGDLHSRIFNMAYESDYVIDSIVLRNGAVWYHTLCLSDITEDIKLVKLKIAEITEKKNYVRVTAPVAQTFRNRISEGSGPLIKEVIVNLKDQEKVIIEQLTRGSRRRDIISIVGMGGIGKTTLAKKVFNDHSVKEDFNVRAWCSVSVTYQKRDLLLEILSYIPKPSKKDLGVDIADSNDQNDEFDKDTDDDIAHKLCQRLMGRKYVIVMDDLWDIQAWRDMQMSFPDDLNGSRILFTCRDSVVASKAGGTSEPHPLRELSEEESWKLLETKVFHGKDCPEELLTIGKRIAIGCKGLPLAVVAIGGLLERTNKTVDWWKDIADDINTHIAEDPKSHCMNILELSFKHLPDNLKPCFLYFGAFWGNKEIPVKKLLWLWIAEGFVSKNDPDGLIEDVAEAYLDDLICRSMIVATKERSQGGFKSCRVHDLLRTLCVSKAAQDFFLQSITGYEIFFRSSSQRADYGVDPDYVGPSLSYEQHRISIHSKRNHLAMLKPSGSQTRSLLFYATTDTYPRCPYDVSFIVQNFRLLRVLDLETINMGISFPSGIEMLKGLKYLAVSGDIDSVPSSVAKLWNLETLCVKGLKGQVVVPDDIWSLESLRHLHVNDTAIFRLPEDKSSSKPCHLITLSSPSLSCGEAAEKMMKRLPGLRKLKCLFSKSHDHSTECKRSPVLIDLTKLESLKISYYGDVPSSCELNFGSSLKKLSISYCHLPNKYVSIIGELPNLTVLKLLSVAFDDERWSMSDGEFISLKYLKLDNVAISEWEACSDHLPGLQRLVLNNCKKLEEVPLSFQEIAALQTIELQRCSQSAEDSVKEIHIGQQDLGKKNFKLFINLLEWDHLSS